MARSNLGSQMARVVEVAKWFIRIEVTKWFSSVEVLKCLGRVEIIESSVELR